MGACSTTNPPQPSCWVQNRHSRSAADLSGMPRLRCMCGTWLLNGWKVLQRTFHAIRTHVHWHWAWVEGGMTTPHHAHTRFAYPPPQKCMPPQKQSHAGNLLRISFQVPKSGGICHKSARDSREPDVEENLERERRFLDRVGILGHESLWHLNQ